MIVRSWHGVVPAAQGEAFRAYLLRTGVAETQAILGNRGSYIYSRERDGWEHFFMVSYWDNWEAIRIFAGPDPQIAVDYPEDRKFGLIADPIVLHHEVVGAPAGFPGFSNL